MFPFRKKPPSKVEVVKQGVSDAAYALLHAIPAEKIEDKFDDLKKTAAQVALHAAQVAHHASEVAAHKFDELQQAAGTLGGSVADVAQQSSEVAAVKAQAARESALAAKDALQNRAASLKDSAATLQSTLRDRANREAGEAKDEVSQAKADAKEAKAETEIAIHLEARTAKAATKAAQQKEAKLAAEQAARQKLEAAQQRAEEAKAKAKAEAKEQAEAAKEKAKEQAEAAKAKIEAEKDELKVKTEQIEVPRVDLGAVKAHDVEIEYADSSSKWLWIAIGLVAGVVLAIFFAPTTGRRSRAAIKDRLGKVSDGAADAATAASDKIVDIAQRVEGLAQQAEAKLAADVSSEDDATIADRVRSILGHHEIAKTLERINVDCAEGVVTLRGPLLDAPAQEAIIAAVKAVPGVKDVVSDFLTDEKPADPSTYAS